MTRVEEKLPRKTVDLVQNFFCFVEVQGYLYCEEFFTTRNTNYINKLAPERY